MRQDQQKVVRDMSRRAPRRSTAPPPDQAPMSFAEAVDLTLKRRRGLNLNRPQCRKLCVNPKKVRRELRRQLYASR